MNLVSNFHNRHTQFIEWFRSDGRHFQIVSQVCFLCYGIVALGWNADYMRYAAAFSGCVAAQFLAIRFAGYPAHSLKSALITSLGLCLLLKANSPWLFLFAALFAIGQKFLIRINGKHLWNPANFGIVLMIILSGDAWISPGQWGSGAVLVFIIGTAGLAVLSNIRRLDTGIIFIITLAALEYARVVLFLGWGHDVWLHKLSSGSLWLFSFFMITDPMTSPSAKKARIIWAIGVACVSFYLANFKFINAAPFWVLFFATPVTPFIDYLAKGKTFNWIKSRTLVTQS
ncbi:MAG: RnfABCDGE type electron transport complex subunit D [Flavobacteriales bacterium]